MFFYDRNHNLSDAALLSDWVSKCDKKESINFYLDLILKVLNPQLISVWCIIYALKLYLNAFHNHIHKSISDWLNFYWLFLIGQALWNWCRSKSTNRIRVWWQSIRLSSQNRSYEIKNTWTWDESENVDKTRNWWQMGVGDIDLLMKLKMEIILILLNWILPFLIKLHMQTQKCLGIAIDRFYVKFQKLYEIYSFIDLKSE